MSDPNRPYVDARIVDVGQATRLAGSAADAWDLPAPDLLRVGMNAIFTAGDVVIRVGRATAPAAAAHRLADTVRSSGVPVVSPVAGAAMDVDGYAVTAWERITTVDDPIDWVAVGRGVARIHRLDAAALPDDYPAPSPTSFPWWRFDDLVAEVRDHVDDAAHRGLQLAIDDGRWWADEIDRQAVVCHGDVHPGNVMMTAEGPVLIDFDLLCRAAPAWDHAMLTTYAARWGGDAAVYERFRLGYGDPAVDAELAASLGELRNVAATLMRVKAGRTDPAAAAEAEHRLRFWRGESDAAWRAQ